MTFSQVSSPLPKSALLEFLQALNHELRTPLSVISNELYLLRSQSEGASRALEKVKEIDLLLTSIEAFVAPHVLNTPDTVVKSPMHLLLLKFTNEHP
ncbi:MAG: hypothetical protein KDD60_00150, partial [Bdellovibrionales bacterium]|nr:hypothetical protein [Bdellovibrionales bacterium]